MPHLIVIGGPTASGKTRLAIEVAQHYGTVILSADSRQFYRELRIGAAPPSAEELAAAPHYFIADRSVRAPLSAGRYADEAMNRLAELFEHHEVVVVVGGSGLYLRALCEGLDEFPPVLPVARQTVRQLQERRGLRGLQDWLRAVDPGYYDRVDQQNGRRLQRALEVSLSTGRPYSSFLGQPPPRPFDCHYFMPEVAREELYRRIDQRVDRMLTAGLEAEVRSLLPLSDLRALQTVGYQEWWPYFAGTYSRERAVECIKRNSRRYAKRQLTYFRNYQKVSSANVIAKYMVGRFG